MATKDILLAFIKKWHRVILAVLGISVAIWFVDSSQFFQDCVCQQYNAYTQQPPKERSSILYFVYGGCLWSWIDKNNAPVIALFTIIIGAFTGLLFTDGRDKARRELRAYLGIANAELYLLPNRIPRAFVEIKNFGNTPAYKVVPSITGEARELSDNRPFPEPDAIPHRQPLAPTMTWTVGREFIELSKDSDLQDLAARKKWVYVWGSVTYEDIFEDPHTLRFRFRNVVQHLNEHGQITRWYFYPEDDGNEEE